MVLVIDTSSARAAAAVIDGGRCVAEVVTDAGRGLDVARLVESVCDPRAVDKVAVATGPGSFTGLRAGAAYALGLAHARSIPIHALSTLDLAAARAKEPATGLAEAGRGRVYHKAPGAAPGVGGPEVVPGAYPATGWLRESTVASLLAAGVRLLEEAQLRPFWEAAATILGRAPEVPYGRLRIEYMSSGTLA
jgi:tRNA threonylcarbamoyl adenosine modification protein YeaZ